MRNLNKSLLTAAVVGALSLPGLAAAADLSYAGAQQITYAKDLIVNNGTTIETPNTLQLIGEASDATRLATIAGDAITVKVTLTDGARFDATAPAPVLVATFLEGAQTGGTGNPLAVVGTPYYSATGQELNFTYTASGAGVVGAAGDYFLQINSMQVTNLVDGLFEGAQIGAQITAQNAAGQQVLASSEIIARSKWGVTVETVAGSGDLNKTIDVAACADSERKTLFAPLGGVGGSCGAAPANGYFNAGAFELDIAKAVPTDGSAESYVNNFDATAAQPQYNVVATADINVTVTGSNLDAFDGFAMLSSVATCDDPTGIAGDVDADGNLVFSAPASNAMWGNVTNAPPSPSTVYVCLLADEFEMEAQPLAGSVSIDYNLDTQRVNPPAMGFDLLPLRLNGSTIIFQNVNPGKNSTAQSFLRMTNNNADVCPVSIVAKDDAGRLSGEVSAVIGPHASLQLNSDMLENGGKAGTTGSFGDGTGKWYVRITAECSNFKASALNRHHDGVVTDLTPEKQVGNEWLTPSTKL